MFQSENIALPANQGEPIQCGQTAGQDHADSLDEMTGAGAVPVPGFVATHHELLQLARYWTRLAGEMRFSGHASGNWGFREEFVTSFAQRRIENIASFLGKDVVDRIVAEVNDELADSWPEGCAGPSNPSPDEMEILC